MSLSTGTDFHATALVPKGLNELSVADITYVAVAIGFVYLPAILDAWSRRVVASVGPTSMRDLAPAVLQAAIATQQPPASGTNHSDRDSQYRCRALSCPT